MLSFKGEDVDNASSAFSSGLPALVAAAVSVDELPLFSLPDSTLNCDAAGGSGTQFNLRYPTDYRSADTRYPLASGTRDNVSPVPTVSESPSYRYSTDSSTDSSVCTPFSSSFAPVDFSELYCPSNSPSCSIVELTDSSSNTELLEHGSEEFEFDSDGIQIITLD